MQDDEFGDNIDWSAVELPSISASMMVAQPRPQGGRSADGQSASANRANGEGSALHQGQWNHGNSNLTDERGPAASAPAVSGFGGAMGDDGPGGRAIFSEFENTGDRGNNNYNQQRGGIGGSHYSHDGANSGSSAPSNFSSNNEDSLRRQVSSINPMFFFSFATIFFGSF